LPQFQKLREKEDIDVKAFVATIDAIVSSLDDPATKQKAIEAIKKQFQNQGTTSTLEIIKKQFPAFQLLEKYLWVIYAVTVVSIWLPISSIILSPLGMLYTLIINAIMNRKE
jgi:hypothetical protein